MAEEDGGCSCPSSTSIGEEDEFVGSTAMGTGEDDDDCNTAADEEARASDGEGNVLPSLEEDIRRRIASFTPLLLRTSHDDMMPMISKSTFLIESCRSRS